MTAAHFYPSGEQEEELNLTSLISVCSNPRGLGCIPSPGRSHCHSALRQVNLSALEKFVRSLWNPLFGSRPIRFLWTRWVCSLTVLNYAEGRRLRKDYGMTQGWMGLWSVALIEFGWPSPLEERKESGEWFPLFLPSFGQCETKDICFLRECVHIKKPFPLPKACSCWALIRYFIVWSVAACLSCV